MIKSIILIFVLLIYTIYCKDINFSTNEKNVFRELEGKVPTLKIDIDEAEYQNLIDISQIDMEKLVVECNLDASLLPSFETKVTLTYEQDG